MNELLQSSSKRREVMSDQIEQSDRYQAVQSLTKLGILKKVSDLELYHGRASDGKKWSVQPDFDNSGNNTGNHNINKKPALSTSDYEIAKEFAQERAHRNKSSEVHRITSSDPDAMIVVADITHLNKVDKKKATEAIDFILPSITEGAPIDFNDRDKLNRFRAKVDLPPYGLIFEEDIPKLEKLTDLDKKFINHISSAINTRQMLKNGWLSHLCVAFWKDHSSINVDFKNQKRKTPINHEYLANWFRTNHIIGYRADVNSATVAKRIDNYLIFDLEKINTPQKNHHIERNRERFFGKIAFAANQETQNTHSRLVEMLASDLYVKPQEIVNAAKKTPGFQKIFEADAGNWEGFTLGEHTETTLRVFDDNYADKLPASILPIMRMALLTHDIGKSVAASKKDKVNQKFYNLAYANKFLNLNNVDESTSNLILSMIGDGMELTQKLVKDRSNQATKDQLQTFCTKTLKAFFKTDNIDSNSVRGFRNLLEILQTCDSAAYTTMAVTRADDNTMYRNYGSFNKSFNQYKGFTGKRAKLKSHHEFF